MRIDGLFELKKLGKKFAAPGKIQVRIGSPIHFPADSDPEEIARALQQSVEGL
jgi:1-acyl-sn-glycerol-3-phosphate acyltransferase